MFKFGSHPGRHRIQSNCPGLAIAGTLEAVLLEKRPDFFRPIFPNLFAMSIKDVGISHCPGGTVSIGASVGAATIPGIAVNGAAASAASRFSDSSLPQAGSLSVARNQSFLRR